jgi:SPP1 family phage portal protein
MRKDFYTDQQSLSPDLIRTAVEFNLEYFDELSKLYSYYIGEHTAILQRQKASSLSNHKVITNHAKYITNVNIGYLLGNPVEYQVLEDIDIEKIKDSYKRQFIALTDNTISKNTSIFGKSYELIYSNKDNELKSKPIDPRYCVLIKDDTVEHNPLFAVIYKPTKTYFKQLQKDRKVVESATVYDAINMYTYNSDMALVDTKPHGMGALPVIEYKNNDEMLGDFENVMTLIDAYNILQSDRVNDKEQLVNALLFLKNVTVTTKILDEIMTNRVLAVQSDADAKYLVKQLNEADMDILKKTIEQDIHKISMTPNLSDENFIGNASGVAIRYKLLVFEQNIQNKELYFTEGLKNRMQAYNNYYSSINAMPEVDVENVQIVFKRNLPQNDYETSQMITNLTGLVSNETLISQLSFVEDAEKESEWVEEEKKEEMTGDSNFGTEEPDTITSSMERLSGLINNVQSES